MTNADKIRSMRDGELLAFFCKRAFNCPPNCECQNKDCKECWYKWLKEEAEECG